MQGPYRAHYMGPICPYIGLNRAQKGPFGLYLAQYWPILGQIVHISLRKEIFSSGRKYSFFNFLCRENILLFREIVSFLEEFVCFSEKFFSFGLNVIQKRLGETPPNPGKYGPLGPLLCGPSGPFRLRRAYYCACCARIWRLICP